MVIEPISGLVKNGEIVSEKEFASFSIFSTAKMLREYFIQYGYQFIGFYCGNEDVIVVKDNNLDVAAMTGDIDVYHAFNYKEGVIVQSRLGVADALVHSHFHSNKQYCFTHAIESTERGMQLVEKASSTVILEAEMIMFLDGDKVLVSNYGLESIYSLSEGISYPLMKTEPTVYSGKYPDEFVDMRFGMYVTFQSKIQTFPAFRFSLREIVSKYPYGEKIGNRFHLLNYPIKYGIFYKNLNITRTQWYLSEEARDGVLLKLGMLVEDTLDKKYTYVKKD